MDYDAVYYRLNLGGERLGLLLFDFQRHSASRGMITQS